VKVTIAGADVSRYYNGDQFGRTSVQLSAFDLEVGLGTVVIPEIAGTDAFVTGRQCMVEQGTTVLVDGFIASDDRGRLETEPTKPRREWTMSLEDANAITSNIRAIDWTRSSETCTARILARITADGLSVDTTWVQSTSATLPAKKYKTGDIWSELATDAIERTGWTLFVHDKAAGGRCFHFHSLTTGHACGLSITDVMGAWDNVTSFVPISPRRIRDPADLRNDILLEDQAGRTATVTDSTSISAHDADGRQHQDYVQVDADSQADLNVQAARMLLDRKDDITTYECTIGPLNETALGSIRVGDMMTVTSQVFGLTASSQRIANMTLTPLGPTLWTATLELSRPVRHGNKIPGLGGDTGGGGNSDPSLDRQNCNDCPPLAPQFDFASGVAGPTQSLANATVKTAIRRVKGTYATYGTTGDTSTTATSPVAAVQQHAYDLTLPHERAEADDHIYIQHDAPGPGYTHARLETRLTPISIKPLSGTPSSYPASVARGWGAGTPTFDSVGASIFGQTIPPQHTGDPITHFADVDVYFPVSASGIVQFVLLLTASFTATNAANEKFPHPGEPDEFTANRYPALDPTAGTWGSYDQLQMRQPPGYTTADYNLTWYTVPLLSGSGPIAPTSGQQVPPESAGLGNGTTTTFSTSYPYMAGSLHATVNSVDWTNDIASQNPSTGAVTFTHAPKAGSDILFSYRAA
jgi:hypothetical protein